MKKHSLLLLIIIALITFTQFSCNTTGPGPTRDVELSVSDVSCTEAWLNLTVNNLTSNTKVQLVRNSSVVNTINITSHDTTLYDDSLSPNKTYNYQVIELQNGTAAAKSEMITAKTMDTTSNNFTWQFYILGNYLTGNSSKLYDIAIINDTDAWAVGEIYENDSTGTYNSEHWNGLSWRPLKIMFPLCDTSGNIQNSWTYPTRGIFAISFNNIWFCSGGSLAHWNGKNFEEMCMSLGYGNRNLTRLWGNNNQIYLTGTNGFIAQYSNNIWQNTKTGTTEDLFDIYSNDGKTIYASGGNFNTYDGVLLKGENNRWQIVNEGKIINPNELFHPYFAGLAKTVWVSNTNTVYFGGNLLYRYKFGQYQLMKSLQGNYINGDVNGEYFGFISQVRGTADNDIFLVGEGNTIRHFNGVRWQQLGMPYNYSSSYTWLSLSVKNNLVIVVGYSSTNAIIMKIKRE